MGEFLGGKVGEFLGEIDKINICPASPSNIFIVSFYILLFTF